MPLVLSARNTAAGQLQSGFTLRFRPSVQLLLMADIKESKILNSKPPSYTNQLINQVITKHN